MGGGAARKLPTAYEETLDDTVIINYEKHFLNCIAVILN